MRNLARAGLPSVGLLLLTAGAPQAEPPTTDSMTEVLETPTQSRQGHASSRQTEMNDWSRERLLEPTGIDEAVRTGGYEPTVAVNPNDPDNVAVARGSSLRITTDGGVTWIPALDQSPISFPIPPNGGGFTYGRSGDPSLAFDSQGRLFWATLVTIADSDTGRDVHIAQYDPTTATLIDTANVTAAAGVSGSGGAFNHDKEWLAADHWNSSPYRDRLYMVWSPLQTASFQIYAAYSTDQGETWTMSNPFPLSLNAEGKTWPPHITVAPNGDVYIAYHSQPGFEGSPDGRLPDGTSGQIIALRSTDGGANYSQRSTPFGPGESDITWNIQHVTPNPKTVPNTQFWMQGASQPWILADPFVAGRIYVLTNDDPDDTHGSGDEGNVYMVISDDDGVTWSDPERVDTGPGTTLQTMPTAAIDPETGCIVVHYYDTRNGAVNSAGNLLLDVYATTSSDGGITFAHDYKISDIPFDPDAGASTRFNGPPPTTRIGEYNGVDMVQGKAYAVWTGNTFDNSGNATGMQTILDPMTPPMGFLPDTLSAEFQPPDPWGQEGVVVDTIELAAEVDLLNLRFVSEPLQCFDVPCETDHIKKIHHDNIEFVPPVVSFLAAGDTVEVEVKRTVPIGQAACTYVGTVHATAQTNLPCFPEVSDDLVLSLEVKPVVDVDIDDNQGNLSDNVMYLKGAKGDFVQGTFVVVNPNSWDQNVDFPDGPGNIGVANTDSYLVSLEKVGDPAVHIPNDAVHIVNLPDYLGSGEAAEASVQIFIPDDGIPVNAFYRGRLVVEYENCQGGASETESFDIELHVLPTQGTLDIVQTDIAGDFCPDDPWIQEGQVFLSFDVHANGDHRNIRVASGGLRHDTLDKKLDLFNFYPEEIAFLAAGETRTINVITKIPIGQCSGSYAEYFRVVSESGGEDSVHAQIDICELYDLDIRDDYGNLSANVMEIQAISRAAMSGGQWALRAFDMGLPAGIVGNDDNFDGPGNAPVDCVECRFAEWSPMWHEDDPDHNFYSGFDFTGYGVVHGDSCDWSAGEFRRMLISVFVPPMTMHDNNPGTYKGRLLCAAIAGADTVSQDFFDIEMHLARIVGPAYEKPPEETSFTGLPMEGGAKLSWGDFSGVGLTGGINLYRQNPETGTYVRLNTSPLPHRSEYVDHHDGAGKTYNYKLGIGSTRGEVLIGPISIGGNPLVYRLAQNAPNPFADRTTISYELPEAGRTTLKVYDVNGRLVRVLKDTEEPAGFYSVRWNRRDRSSRDVAAGIYFYRLEASGFTATKKMLVIDR